jgi:hypothetical protein
VRKINKVFFDINKEQEWLAAQNGWKLVSTNGISYVFEKSEYDYTYEFVYFEKGKKELDAIINGIKDKDIEFVCHSSSRAVFRKNSSKGRIQVYTDNYDKYKMLTKKYSTYMSLGACYMGLGSSQIALSTTVNGLFSLSSALFYICSIFFFIAASSFSKYAKEYDDGTYAVRLKKDKSK